MNNIHLHNLVKKWRKNEDEQLMILVKSTKGKAIIDLDEGTDVFARDDHNGTFTIRPADQLGPTLIGLPKDYLELKVIENKFDAVFDS